ncbi:hypothetical protein D9M68_879280 [compost metagenome]
MHALALDVGQVGQRGVLLAVHKHAWARQREKLVHQLAVVGQRHHRLEDASHRAGAHLVPQAGGIQRAGVGRGMAGALDKVGEETLGIFAGVIVDLSA